MRERINKLLLRNYAKIAESKNQSALSTFIKGKLYSILSTTLPDDEKISIPFYLGQNDIFRIFEKINYIDNMNIMDVFNRNPQILLRVLNHSRLYQFETNDPADKLHYEELSKIRKDIISDLEKSHYNMRKIILYFKDLRKFYKSVLTRHRLSRNILSEYSSKNEKNNDNTTKQLRFEYSRTIIDKYIYEKKLISILVDNFQALTNYKQLINDKLDDTISSLDNGNYSKVRVLLVDLSKIFLGTNSNSIFSIIFKNIGYLENNNGNPNKNGFDRKIVDNIKSNIKNLRDQIPAFLHSERKQICYYNIPSNYTRELNIGIDNILSALEIGKFMENKSLDSSQRTKLSKELLTSGDICNDEYEILKGFNFEFGEKEAEISMLNMINEITKKIELEKKIESSRLLSQEHEKDSLEKDKEYKGNKIKESIKNLLSSLKRNLLNITKKTFNLCKNSAISLLSIIPIIFALTLLLSKIIRTGTRNIINKTQGLYNKMFSKSLNQVEDFDSSGITSFFDKKMNKLFDRGHELFNYKMLDNGLLLGEVFVSLDGATFNEEKVDFNNIHVLESLQGNTYNSDYSFFLDEFEWEIDNLETNNRQHEPRIKIKQKELDKKYVDVVCPRGYIPVLSEETKENLKKAGIEYKLFCIRNLGYYYISFSKRPDFDIDIFYKRYGDKECHGIFFNQSHNIQEQSNGQTIKKRLTEKIIEKEELPEDILELIGKLEECSDEKEIISRISDYLSIQLRYSENSIETLNRFKKYKNHLEGVAKEKIGDCKNVNALNIGLCRLFGIESELIAGHVMDEKGEISGHGITEINIDGKCFIKDATPKTMHQDENKTKKGFNIDLSNSLQIIDELVDTIKNSYSNTTEFVDKYIIRSLLKKYKLRDFLTQRKLFENDNHRILIDYLKLFREIDYKEIPLSQSDYQEYIIRRSNIILYYYSNITNQKKIYEEYKNRIIIIKGVKEIIQILNLDINVEQFLYEFYCFFRLQGIKETKSSNREFSEFYFGEFIKFIIEKYKSSCSRDKLINTLHDSGNGWIIYKFYESFDFSKELFEDFWLLPKAFDSDGNLIENLQDKNININESSSRELKKEKKESKKSKKRKKELINLLGMFYKNCSPDFKIIFGKYLDGVIDEIINLPAQFFPERINEIIKYLVGKFVYKKNDLQLDNGIIISEPSILKLIVLIQINDRIFKTNRKKLDNDLSFEVDILNYQNICGKDAFSSLIKFMVNPKYRNFGYLESLFLDPDFVGNIDYLLILYAFIQEDKIQIDAKNSILSQHDNISKALGGNIQIFRDQAIQKYSKLIKQHILKLYSNSPEILVQLYKTGLIDIGDYQVVYGLTLTGNQNIDLLELIFSDFIKNKYNTSKEIEKKYSMIVNFLRLLDGKNTLKLLKILKKKHSNKKVNSTKSGLKTIAQLINSNIYENPKLYGPYKNGIRGIIFQILSMNDEEIFNKDYQGNEYFDGRIIG